MKVLLLNNFNYRRGGAENVFLGEYEMLCEKGHSVSIFSRKHPNNYASKNEKYFPSEMKTNTVELNKKSFQNLSKIFYNLEAKKRFEKNYSQRKI